MVTCPSSIILLCLLIYILLPLQVSSFADAPIFLFWPTPFAGWTEAVNASRKGLLKGEKEAKVVLIFFTSPLTPTYRCHHCLSALPLRMPSVWEATASFLLFSFFPAYPFPFLSLLRLFPCLAFDVGWWPTAIGRSWDICWHDDVGHLFPYLIIYRGLNYI